MKRLSIFLCTIKLISTAILLICISDIIVGSSVKTGDKSLKSDKKYSLEDFSFNLNSSLSPSNHLWVMSGWSTVTPVPNTVMGVGECIGPPLAGMDFKLLFKIAANGHMIPDAGSTGKGDVGLLYSGGHWQPDRITRTGTYHYIVANELISPCRGLHKRNGK